LSSSAAEQKLNRTEKDGTERVTRRLLITITALVLAGAGVSSVLAYVRRADSHALAGMKAVSVLVAQKSIPAGTMASAALQQGLLASQKLPTASVPADAVTAISADLSSLVLNATLPSGQLLLRPMLVTAAPVTGGMVIPPGMVAVSARFCLPEAVAGSVQAGSEVAVLDTVVASVSGQVTAQPACDGPHQQPAASAVKTRVVLDRVRVLSVGSASASGQSGSTASSSSAQSSSASSAGSMLVTLAVSQASAEKIVQLAETGLPYLALLSPYSTIKADAGHLLDKLPTPASTPATSAPATPAPAVTIHVNVTPVTTQPSRTPTPTPATTQVDGPSSEHATPFCVLAPGGRKPRCLYSADSPRTRKN
jgi:pilus assembly protein CpaB